jgi:hypothetical protein
MNLSFDRFLVHKSRKLRKLCHGHHGDATSAVPSYSSMNETALLLEEALAISDFFHRHCVPEDTK